MATTPEIPEVAKSADLALQRFSNSVPRFEYVYSDRERRPPLTRGESVIPLDYFLKTPTMPLLREASTDFRLLPGWTDRHRLSAPASLDWSGLVAALYASR